MLVLSSWFNNFIVILLTGFVGGASFQCLYGWMKPIDTAKMDAIAVANTYIVFTTIIFVIATIVLAVAGYYFSLKFSESQEAQETRIAESLIRDAKKSEQLGTKLIQAVLENGDVKRMIDEEMRNKVTELFEEFKNEKQSSAARDIENAQRSVNDAVTAEKLSAKIKNGGSS